MAWVATDDFNSYADGDLNGNNGGTGWSAAWAANVEWDIQGTTVFEGAKAVQRVGGAAETDSTRDITTAVTSGIVRIAVRRTSKAANRYFYQLWNIANGARWSVIFGTADITLTDGAGAGAVTIVSAYAVDTWYVIHVSFDTGANTAKAREDSQTVWTANVTGTNSGGVDRFRSLSDANMSGTVFIDDIRAGSEPVITINVSDQLNITESVSITLINNINVSDQLNITESVSITLINNINVSDQLNITESITVTPPQANISVSDQLNITDVTTVYPETLILSVSDQINITENVQTSVDTYISVNDSLSISESVSMMQLLSISVNDSITLSESVTGEIISRISVNDSINITESASRTVSEIRQGIAIMRGRSQDYPLGMDDSTIE